MSKVLLDIDNEMVMEAVKSQVATTIADQMGGINGVAQKMIEFALTAKCGIDGKVSNYSSDNKYTFMDAIILTHIREAAKQIVEEHIQENMADLKAEIKKQLSTKKTQSALTDALLKAVGDTLSCKYSHSISIDVKGKSY